MAQKTDAQLTTDANVIRDETAEGGNTRARVSSHTKDIVDSKINNDQVDTANTLDTSSKTIPGRDAVKSYIAAAIAAINPLFLGLYTSLSALETAYPTADSGQYAIVDPGSGTDAVKYIWDEDEGWVAGSSGPGSNLWADLVGDPSDNTAFNSYITDLLAGINADFATKADALISAQSHAGNYTLLAGDLALVLAGDVLKYIGDDSGDLTVPLNATVAFPVGTSLALIGYDNVVATGGVTITGTRGDLTVPTGTTAVLEKTATNTWTLHNGSPSTAASETDAGSVELATSAEVITGTDTTKAVTSAGLHAKVVGVQDMYIPASAMWPRATAGCQDLTRTELSTSLLNIQTLDFDQTTQEYAQFTLVCPRKWNNGTVTVVVYWTADTGSGGVAWGISGGAYSNDDALTVAFGTEQVVTDTLIATNDLHITAATSAMTLAGSPADADFLGFQVTRIPSNGSDTLTGDAKLLGISIRFTTDAAKDA